MSEVLTVSKASVKKWIVRLAIAGGLLGGWQGVQKQIAFVKDYRQVSRENHLMWQYLTQELEMTDGQKPSRANLLDVIIKERFGPKKN